MNISKIVAKNPHVVRTILEINGLGSAVAACVRRGDHINEVVLNNSTTACVLDVDANSSARGNRISYGKAVDGHVRCVHQKDRIATERIRPLDGRFERAAGYASDNRIACLKAVQNDSPVDCYILGIQSRGHIDGGASRIVDCRLDRWVGKRWNGAASSLCAACANC